MSSDSDRVSVEPVALRPQHRCQDAADQRQLGEAFGEIEQRLLGEQPLRPGQRRDLREFWRQRLDRPHQAMLDGVAGDRRDGQQQQRDAERADHLDLEPLAEPDQPAAVHRQLVGVGDHTAQRGPQRRPHRHRERH
jgi:hypothetical protein